MQISDYLESILDIISASPYLESKSVSFEERPPNAAYITGILTFINGSKLHFKEFIVCKTEDIIFLKYAYNYLTQNDTIKYINEISKDKEIDLVIETIGGSSDNILNIVIDLLKSKKHLVTANKALLAEKGDIIFNTAKENNVIVGYEASVCAAIPIIKTITESFTGDDIISISGIMK